MVKVTGEVRQIQEKQIFNEKKSNEFIKQVVIIETLENKTPLRIEFTNQNINLLHDVFLGSIVLLEFSISGNYDQTDKTKVYNSLIAKSLQIFS